MCEIYILLSHRPYMSHGKMCDICIYMWAIHTYMPLMRICGIPTHISLIIREKLYINIKASKTLRMNESHVTWRGYWLGLLMYQKLFNMTINISKLIWLLMYQKLHIWMRHMMHNVYTSAVIHECNSQWTINVWLLEIWVIHS